MNIMGNIAPWILGRKPKFVPPAEPTAVSFQSLTANGTSGTVSTTQLTATFDVDPGLTTANFVVTGASKGVVSKVGAVYTININSITVSDGQSVTLDIINVPTGFTITPTNRTVIVYKAAELEAPTVIATLDFPQATIGVPFSFSIAYVFAGEIDTFETATGTLPSWATLNASTGLITGTPDAESTATGLSFTATNAAGTSSASNTDDLVTVESVVGQGTVEPDLGLNYVGYKHIDITGLVVNDFEIVETPDAVPKQLICKIRPGDISISGGRTLTANEINEFNDLDIRFIITDAEDNPVPDYFGLLHPITDAAFDLFSDTKEGNYHAIVPAIDNYKVTCLVKGQNGEGFVRVNSLSKTFNVTENAFPVKYADSVNGNSAYDGLSAFVVSGTAAYTNATKRVTGTGLFADYDHTAASANINPVYNYNYMYFTGANEGGFPAGRYEVAAKISDDEIELAEALGADYTGVTFSTGPKAAPPTDNTLTGNFWYVTGEWTRGELQSTRMSTYIVGYKGGFRLTNPGTDQIVLAAGIGSSINAPADHRFFMANGVVDGEFKNTVVGRSLSSTGSGTFRDCYHNVEFKGAVSGTTFSAVCSADGFIRHWTFLGCKFDGLLNNRNDFTSAGNPSGTTVFLPIETIPPETPQTGYIWYLNDAGRLQPRIAYTSWDVDGFVLASATVSDCGSENYCISSGSVEHSYNVYLSMKNVNWSVGIIFCEFETDSKDDVKDHDAYISGAIDNAHVCYNTFGKGIGSSFAVNSNLAKNIEGYTSHNVSVCDNFMSQYRRFGVDCSITNNTNPREFIDGLLVRGNYSNVLHCLVYYGAPGTVRFAKNVTEDVANLGNDSGSWAAFVGANPEDQGYKAVIDDNSVIGHRLADYSQAQVQRGLEIVDNVNNIDFNSECLKLSSATFDGGVITGNNLYNPSQVNNYVALVIDAGVTTGYTLEAFNTLVDGVNISTNAVTQFLYNVDDYEVGGTVPFLRPAANNPNSVTNSIFESTLPSGVTGNIALIGGNLNSVNLALIIDEIGAQTGTVTIAALMKGTGSTTSRTYQPKPCPRIQEDGAEPEWVAGGLVTTFDNVEIQYVVDDVFTRSGVAGGISTTNFNANWYWVETTVTGAGIISTRYWAYDGSRPETPVYSVTLPSNELANAFVGFGMDNTPGVHIAAVAVGINGSPAPWDSYGL